MINRLRHDLIRRGEMMTDCSFKLSISLTICSGVIQFLSLVCAAGIKLYLQWQNIDGFNYERIAGQYNDAVLCLNALPVT